MLPVNLLNAIKEYTQTQRTPLPVAATDPVPKPAQQFELGQKLQGIVQAQVAPNVFKVNVSGQLVQMQLPPTINSGDTVALQVIGLQPRLTFSMVNSANPLSTPEQLGATAKMLSSMSQQMPEKAYVRAAQATPLWEIPKPPEPKQLAGMLREALSNSGLFYESHQAQWLGGERSTAQLMHEPQNLPPEQARAVTAGNNGVNKAAIMAEIFSKPLIDEAFKSNEVVSANVLSKATSQSDPAGNTGDSAKSTPAVDISGKPVMGDAHSKAAMTWDAASKSDLASNNSSPVVTRSGTDPQTSTPVSSAIAAESKSQSIPDHLQPLVQQQLNALETRQLIWQGNVWPGQDMQWEVHEQGSQSPDMAGQRQWVTQVQLDLPNLGVVAATLRLNSAGLSLTLNAETSQTRTVLGSASTQLVSALSDAGIPVLSTKVASEPEKPAP